MLIFILSGKARVGKDTVGDIIEKFYKDKKVVKIGCADYIKQYAKNLTNWNGNEEDKPRDLLQVIGTDIVRNKINEDFFVNRLCEDILVYKYFADVLIITGARFPNELEKPKQKFKNVITIKVTRDNFKNNLTQKQNNHLSEISLDNYSNYDYIIENNSSLDKLEDKVIELLKKYEEV